MNKKVVDQYLGAVKKNLHCSAKKKREFLSDLEQGLHDFSQETPNLTMEALIEAFGTPEAQANEFMNTLDSTDIKKAFTWKKILLIAVIVIVAVYIIGITILFIDGHIDNHGRGVEYIGDDDSGYEIVTEEYY